MPWVFDAPIQTSGAALKWFIETFGKEEQLEADAKGENIFQYLNEKALLAKPGSGGLFFFPYLLGERAPLWNSYARGMFIGMAMDTSRADIVRSIFEGTSYALRHVVETIRESGGTAKTLRICGGGAKSKTWSMFGTIAAMDKFGELKAVTPPQAEFVPVKIVPFTMPGSDEVADKVVEALGEKGRAVVIKNHGMMCCGKNIKAAMAAAIYTEEMAQTNYYAKLLGVFEPMPQEAVDKMQALIAADQAV
jgi:Sugar (pentulose and hexulose) kinases